MSHCPFVLRKKLEPLCLVFVSPRVVIRGGVVTTFCNYSKMIFFCVRVIVKVPPLPHKDQKP